MEAKLALSESRHDSGEMFNIYGPYLHGLHYIVYKQNRLACLEHRELKKNHRERKNVWEWQYTFSLKFEKGSAFFFCYNPRGVIICEFYIRSLIVHCIKISTFRM